jgi:2-aminoadipate transaminase
MTGMDSSAIREILHVSNEPGIISLLGGLPASELFPVDELHEAIRRRLCLQRPPSLMGLHHSSARG